MTRTPLQNPEPKASGFPPTQCLLRKPVDQFSLTMIYRRIMEGFSMKEMQVLIEGCVFQSTKRTMLDRLAILSRTSQRHRTGKGNIRLSSRQSALAFQYAQVLELSILVFGSRTSAEEWLIRPCKFLDDNVPLAMVENVIGAQAVEEYLKRIESGIYQ